MAGSAPLVRHNTVPGVEFRGRRFTPGRAVWRPNVAARDDAVHLSGRDHTFRHRSADRDEALVGASALRGYGYKSPGVKARIWTVN